MSSSSVVQNENLKFDNGNAENQLDSGDESAELQIDESWDSPPRKESISNYEGTSDLGATESWDEITDQNTTCTDNQATDEDQQIVDSSNSFGGETSSSAILNQPTSDDSLFQTQNEYCVLSYNETDVSTYLDQYWDEEFRISSANNYSEINVLVKLNNKIL